MTTPANLKRFEVSGSGKEFTLHIEDDRGSTVELAVTRDQLDVLADSLDDILLQDEAGDEVED